MSYRPHIPNTNLKPLKQRLDRLKNPKAFAQNAGVSEQTINQIYVAPATVTVCQYMAIHKQLCIMGRKY